MNAKRRLIAAAALALLATQAHGATTWKAMLWGSARAATQPWEWLAKEAAAKSGGQMKIETVYAQTKPLEALELLKSGAADAAYVCASYFPEPLSLMGVIELPMFAPDSVTVVGRAELALADHPAVHAQLAKSNVKVLLPAPQPQIQLMGTRRVARIDDLKGAKVRVAGEMGRILEDYGAVPKMVPAVEALEGLKKGSFDLLALPYPWVFAQYKVQEASKYVTDKISLGTSFCSIGVSQKSWNALPAATQKIMLSLREPAVAQYEGIYAREDAASIEAFKKQGLEFVAFSQGDRARLVAKAIKFWQAWVDEREKQGLKGREVFEFAQAKLREASPK